MRKKIKSLTIIAFILLQLVMVVPYLNAATEEEIEKNKYKIMAILFNDDLCKKKFYDCVRLVERGVENPRDIPIRDIEED